MSLLAMCFFLREKHDFLFAANLNGTSKHFSHVIHIYRDVTVILGTGAIDKDSFKSRLRNELNCSSRVDIFAALRDFNVPT